jgi:hypothetical protein
VRHHERQARDRQRRRTTAVIDEGESMTAIRRTRTTARTMALAVALAAGAMSLAGCGAVSLTGSPVAASGTVSPTSTLPPPGAPGATMGTTPPAGTTSPSTSTSTSTSATATATPTPKAAPRQKSTPTPTPTPTAKKPGDSLNPGDSGAYVETVQRQLSDLGYWNGTPDGQFGQLTVQAVMALQKAAGLGRDGVFGPATRRALLAGVRPTSQVGGTGIEIDKARQLLLVVRGGQVTMILNTSTGSGQHYSYEGQDAVALTPSGTFSVFRTVDHLDKGPLGDLWRPRYFNGGIAVHGAAAIPGYPASHGCARLSDAAMDMIWADGLMPVGSRVVVY